VRPPLEPGAEIPALTKCIDRVQLVRYAGASGDFNPIHFDHLFAQQAGQPSVIAHGMLTMGFLGELLTRWSGPASVRHLQARFQAITYPGDTIICRGRLLSLQDGVAALEIWAEKPDGTRTASGSAEVLYAAGCAG
jgi:acyl dehydratase